MQGSRADVEVSSRPREEEQQASIEENHSLLHQPKRSRRAESSDGSNLGVTTASAPMPEPSGTAPGGQAEAAGVTTATDPRHHAPATVPEEPALTQQGDNDRPGDELIIQQMNQIRQDEINVLPRVGKRENLDSLAEEYAHGSQVYRWVTPCGCCAPARSTAKAAVTPFHSQGQDPVPQGAVRGDEEGPRGWQLLPDGLPVRLL